MNTRPVVFEATDVPLTIHVDGVIYSLQPHGGISRVFNNLLPALAALDGVKVRLYLPCRLLTSLTLPRSIDCIEYPEQIRLRPARVMGGVSRRWNVARQSRYWRSLRDGIFVSTHYTTYPQLHIPQVQIIQDMIYERLPDLFPSDWDMRHRQQKAMAASRAGMIICPSQCSLNDVREIYGLPETSGCVIPYAVDDRFRRQPSRGEIRQFRQRHGIDVPYVLHTGSRYLHKNFAGLMVAFSQWHRRDEFRLVSIGGGFLTGAEQALALGLGITSRLTVIPAVEADELVLAYHAASVFAFPSLYEGFGFPLVEAVACGVPSLASKASCLPDVGGPSVDYFLPDNVDDFVGCLERAALVERSSASLATARARILERTWDEVAADVASVGRGLLNPACHARSDRDLQRAAELSR